MSKKNKNLFRLVAAGLFSILFLTLLTISFYGYVLEQIGVDHAENVRNYRYHFVMIVANTDSRFWNDVFDSVREEAAKQEAYVELKEKNQSSINTMVDLMDMSIAAKVDGIILECTDEENLDEKVNEATEKGIPVVTILNDAPASERKSFVGINPYQLGQAYGCQLEKMIRKLESEGGGRDREGEYRITVLLNDSSIDSNHFQIFNQINNMMVTSEATAELVKAEAVRIPSGGAFESEEIVWNLFQSAKGPPDIIVCMDEVDTVAVYQAVIDYIRVGKTQVIGYYKSKTTLDAVRRGTMAMTFCIDTEEMGRYSVKAMMECIRDGRTNSFYSVDLQFVTRENADEFMDQ